MLLDVTVLARMWVYFFLTLWMKENVFVLLCFPFLWDCEMWSDTLQSTFRNTDHPLLVQSVLISIAGFMYFFHFFFSSGNTPIAVWGTHLDLIQNPQIRAKHGGKEHVNVSMAAELGITGGYMSEVVIGSGYQLWRLKSPIASRKEGMTCFQKDHPILSPWRSTGPKRDQREASQKVVSSVGSGISVLSLGPCTTYIIYQPCPCISRPKFRLLAERAGIRRDCG